MIQQKHNRYQEQKQVRINQAISSLTLHSDVFGLFSLVPSTSERFTIYSVAIEDGVAARCTCKGNKEHGHYCVHMIATDFYLDAMIEDADLTTVDIPTKEIVAHQACGLDLAIAEYLRNDRDDAYEVLATTKNVEFAYGSCGDMVKPEHAGQVCGACMSKGIW